MNGKGRIITADIETIGLLWDMKGYENEIHVIVAKDYETGEVFTFFDDFDMRINPVWMDDYDADTSFKAGSIQDGVELLRSCEVLIMHNISGFDALAIEKAYGSFKRNHFEVRVNAKYSDIMPYKTMDTVVMSRVLNPERQLPGEVYSMGIKLPGPHTIESHGIRMGRFKPHHEDWSCLTGDMIHRCIEDVEIGESMFRSLLVPEWREQLSRPNKMTGLDIRNAYFCELRMAFSIARQEQRAFAVDVNLMNELLVEMDDKILSVEKAFRPNMPKRIKKKKLTQVQIQGLVNKVSDAVDVKTSLQYEQDLEIGDYKASYATTYWKLVTAKGEYLKNVTKYIPKARGFEHEFSPEDLPVHGPFTPIVWEDIPLGNRDQVKQLLYKFGWKGVNYNDTELAYIEDNNGELPYPWSGKIDSDSIEAWEESGSSIPDWCKGIAEWYVINSRRNQILNKKDTAYFDKNKCWPRQASGKNECRGLLANAVNFDEESIWYKHNAQSFYAEEGHWPTEGHWRVPAKAFHAATNTFRMRHKVVVNIPSRGLYGKEMRKIFIAGPGKMMLGCDASGLELRMLAHFMNDPDYQKIILHGDIHTHNQTLAGLSKRDYAKTFIYAFLYGSGIPNLARQLGLDMHTVEVAVSKFKRELPQLTDLLERVEKAGKKFGYLLAVDGRWGRIRSKGGSLLLHTALNLLLQMTGSLVMKWAHIHAEDECARLGIINDINSFPIVVHMHDEFQGEVEECEVEEVTYQIPIQDWKDEEKRIYYDEAGRMFSAPKIIGEMEDDERLTYTIQRLYHPLGEQYCKALEWAGKHLGLRCPTAGEYMIGDSWADTH